MTHVMVSFSAIDSQPKAEMDDTWQREKVKRHRSSIGQQSFSSPDLLSICLGR